MKYLFLILFTFFPTLVFSQPTNTSTAPGLFIQDEDGDPALRCRRLKVTNGTLTDNMDGSCSLETGGGSGGGDITDVGDCSTGACFTADGTGNSISFEGTTADANELTLTAVNVTGDFTLTLPAATGTLITSDVNSDTNIPAELHIGGNQVLSVAGTNNVILGQQAGTSNTGSNVTILGDEAGIVNTGNNNAFIGYRAGTAVTSGQNNLCLGTNTGRNLTIGNSNVFLGTGAGEETTTASGNLFLGSLAGNKNTIGISNVFIGGNAGFNNTTASGNTFIGASAGNANTIGRTNIYIGSSAGARSTTADHNVMIGATSGEDNLTGENNVFIGGGSGENNTTAGFNVFIGRLAGGDNTIGTNNVFIGYLSGDVSTTAGRNVFVGSNSGGANLTGRNNVYIGDNSGLVNTDGSSNVFIGNSAGSAETGSNLLYITNSSTSTPLIKGDFSSDNLTLNNKLLGGGATPTLSSCGTGPTIVGSNLAGKVTPGTGPISSCTITFSGTWPNAPACTCNNESQVLLCNAVTTTTTVILSVSGTINDGDVFSYTCIGY